MPYHLLPGLYFNSDVHESFIIFGFAMAQSTLHNYDIYQPRNPKAAHITSVSKITLKNWNGHGMTYINSGVGSGGHMS